MTAKEDNADPDPAAETAVGPPAAEETELLPPTAAGAELAWSQDDHEEELPRQPWPVAWATAGIVVLTAVILVAAAGIIGWALRPPAAPRTVIVQSAPAPTTSTVTVQAAPPSTVTIQASPPVPKTTTVRAAPEPTSDATAAPVSDAVYDQRFLDDMQSLGYVITNRSLALSTAHETCRLLRLGESTDQVNRQIAAQTGSSMGDVLQITSSALLTYPDCHGPAHNDGD